MSLPREVEELKERLERLEEAINPKTTCSFVIRNLSHTYKNIDDTGRSGRLFSTDYDGIIDRLNLGRYIEVGMRMVFPPFPEPLEMVSNYERLRMAFEVLGPTFVKLGQILSTRPDLIPWIGPGAVRLQDTSPPSPSRRPDHCGRGTPAASGIGLRLLRGNARGRRPHRPGHGQPS
jgi:hypothetical protein